MFLPALVSIYFLKMAETGLIGRKPERAVLEEALRSGEAEMVAIVGRRRVGKTFLVEQVYGARIVFELTGSQRASLKQLLGNFRSQLTHAAGAEFRFEPPGDWYSAFQMLRQFLQSRLGDENWCCFLTNFHGWRIPNPGFWKPSAIFGIVGHRAKIWWSCCAAPPHRGCCRRW